MTFCSEFKYFVVFMKAKALRLDNFIKIVHITKKKLFTLIGIDSVRNSNN